MHIRERIRWLLIAGVLCVALDQFTKWLARLYLSDGALHSYVADTLRLQLAHNYGAFLSLGESLPAPWRQGLWSIGVGIVLIVIGSYALFAKTLERSLFISLTLIFWGGVSNLYDRIAYGGYVVDFLNMGFGPVRTGIFNVADMAITTGALIVLFTAVATTRKNSHS